MKKRYRCGLGKFASDRAKQILRNLKESELTLEGNVRQPQLRPEREKLKKLTASP